MIDNTAKIESTLTPTTIGSDPTTHVLHMITVVDSNFGQSIKSTPRFLAVLLQSDNQARAGRYYTLNVDTIDDIEH